jgi:hypothetical protein
VHLWATVPKFSMACRLSFTPPRAPPSSRTTEQALYQYSEEMNSLINLEVLCMVLLPMILEEMSPVINATGATQSSAMKLYEDDRCEERTSGSESDCFLSGIGRTKY